MGPRLVHGGGDSGSTTSDRSRFGPDGSIAVVKQTDPTEEAILVTDARALYDFIAEADRRACAGGLRSMFRF